MRRKCGYCLKNPGRFDISTQDYTLDCWQCVEDKKAPKKVVIDEKPIDDDPCDLCQLRPKKWLSSTKKALLCLICDKQMKKEAEQMKANAKSAFVEKTKECRTCKQRFAIHAKTDKDCSTCKEFMSIRKSNENWLKRGPKKKPKMDSDAVAYSFFRKKFTIPNNVFRG